MTDFIGEIKSLSDDEIALIIEDQKDLYTPEEIRLLETEFMSRRVATKETAASQQRVFSKSIGRKQSELIATTGQTIDGYTTEKYIDVVFVDKITGIGIKTSLKSIGDVFASLTGEELYALTERINALKHDAFKELKENAVVLGANALIGIDFETTIPSSAAVMVSVSGTAVIVSKIAK